jgi:HSP20 family molecular chaperone IbpA
MSITHGIAIFAAKENSESSKTSASIPGLCLPISFRVFRCLLSRRRTKMKQQSSAATQRKRTNFDHLFVSPDQIDRYMKNVFDLVARRAHELFESRGWEHGHDSEDWFQAESEIFHPITVEMEDPGDAYTAIAVVSGYRPEDLKISAEPRRLTICGSSEGKESGRPQNESQRSERFFFSIQLPKEIDAAAVSADIRQDVLEIRLPKALTEAGESQGNAEAEVSRG